ncbi:hypothetical protein [Candidatus Mycoplasma haematohominis]|uniref:hypothetical protein n=1 Tax=Candidatus Mycoplasma haematohominis TaxID=1494318 RepID=UPI001C0A7323|nr:hypothetical protein [Candidatus Mycoplasma haemohominis]
MGLKFAPKLGTALVAGGSLGAGGTLAYNNTVPKNIQDALEREGIPFIRSISDEGAKNRAYKAVYVDNKGDIKTTINEINGQSTKENSFSQISTWCDGQLDSSYSWSYLKNNKEKIIKYCADQVPRTVEGRLQRIQDQKWIKDETSGADEAYKTIFAVYRYDQTFLAQINKDQSKSYSSSTTSQEGFSLLKTWCEKQLLSEVEIVKDDNLYSYVFWWCKPIGYKTTVKEKIKHDYTNWIQAGEQDWETIKGLWQHTKDVFSLVDSNAFNSADGTTIQKDKYKEWCGATLKKNLYDDGIYKKDYLVAKSVCVEAKVQKILGIHKNVRDAIANKDSSS